MGQPEEQSEQHDPGENAGPEGAKASSAGSEGSASAAAGRGGDSDQLPNVEAPKLAGEQADSSRSHSIGALPALFSEAPSETASEPAASQSEPPRSLRFALLAATIACAAGLGALAGSLSASRIGPRSVAEAPRARTADAGDVAQALRAQMAELSSLKASLDAANRSAVSQFTKISDRLNSLERAQADPQAKLSHIADTVDRLEKRAAAAPEITGSITTAPAAPAAAQASLPVLRNWEIEGVHSGRALVVSRDGAEFLVGSGSSLPGLGHVQEVKRQDGVWVVVTEKGIITPP